MLKVTPVAREVHTESQTLRGDHLVIALGADLNPDGVPGFAESAYTCMKPPEPTRFIRPS